MPLSTDKIANTPLSGPELKRYSVQLLVDELEIRSVPESIVIQMTNVMSMAMDQDFLFMPGTSYPLAVIHIRVRLHYVGERCAFAVTPSFDLQNPLAPFHQVFVRTPATPPLPLRSDEGGIVECFTITAKTDNPNAIRVHYSIPIRVTTKIPPRPGEMFPTYESETLEFVSGDAPSATPSVKDESYDFALAWTSNPDPLLPEQISEATMAQFQETIVVTPTAKRKRKGWNKGA